VLDYVSIDYAKRSGVLIRRTANQVQMDEIREALRTGTDLSELDAVNGDGLGKISGTQKARGEGDEGKDSKAGMDVHTVNQAGAARSATKVRWKAGIICLPE